MLQGQPGLYVSGFTGNNFEQSIIIRGFTEPATNYVALLVDGVKTTIPRQELNTNFVFPELVDRIEVIRGDSSVAFGNKSLAGAVNVILKKPRQHPGTYFGAEMGSWGMDREWAGVNLVRDTIAAGIFLGNYTQEGWRMYYGNGLDEEFVRRPGPWSLFNVYGSFNWKIAPGLTLDITSNISKSRSVQGDRVRESYYQRRDIRNIGSSGLNLYDDAPDEAWDYLTMGRLTWSGGRLGNFELTASKRTYDRRIQMYAFFGDRMSDQRWEDTYWGAKYNRRDERGFVSNDFTAGIDFYDGKFGRESRAAIGRPANWEFRLVHDGEQSGYRESLSYYLFDTLTLWDRLVLGAGYRIETYDLKDLYANNAVRDITHAQRLLFRKSSAEYSFGFIYDTELGSNIWYKHSRGYRLPNFDDMANYGQTSATDPFWLLDPEEGTLEEWGIRHWLTENIYAGVVYYEWDMDNEIFFDSVNFINRNVSDVSHTGLEADWMVRITPRWTFSGNYTRQLVRVRSNYIPPSPGWDPTRTTEDKERYQTPREMYNMQLKYRNIAWGFSALASYHYVGSRFRINDHFNVLPPLETAKWGDIAFSQSFFDGEAEIHLGIRNVTDAHYGLLGIASSFSSGTFVFPNAGRTYYAGVKTNMDFERMRLPTKSDLDRMRRRLYGSVGSRLNAAVGFGERLRPYMPF